MRCPECGSTNADRYRSPAERQEVILRRHRCRDCGAIYLSAQVVVTEGLVRQLLPLLEQ